MRQLDRLRRAYAAGLRPDAQVWVDEWAEANRIMPVDTPVPGPYRNALTPYLIDIQRTMSPASPYTEGWWQKPVQVGGSVSGENMVATWICAAAGSIAVVFPTLDDAKQWELQRFEPLRSGTRELRKRIRPADEKGADNTKLRKKFPGGVLRLVGANRPIKSATLRYAKLEEPDEYVTDVSGQGNLIDQVRARLKNFGRRRKLFGDGTPTIKGASAICAEAARGDQRHWRLYCPDCRHPQRLEWRQLRWHDGDPASVRYACIDCGALNTEETWKLRNYAPRAAGMTEAQAAAAGLAHWVPTAQGEPGIASWVGFNALGAPLTWRPWPELVTEWQAAQADVEKLKVFANNILAEPYADDVAASVGADALRARAEQYDPMTCPAGGLVCVAGVDTQDNRLAVVIRAFGRGEESWGLFHGEIYGNPSAPETWAKLRELLDAPIRHACGQTMRVDAAAIDAGGHHGEDVYAFCRDAQVRGRHWFAVRGARSYDAPKLGRPKQIDFTWRGQPVAGGGVLRFVGTQAVKNLIDSRLRLTQPGGGYYHVPLGFAEDYFAQMRSERREWRRDAQGHRALWWVKGAGRNEAWDCEVYAYAALLYSMSGRHAEAVWTAREKLFGPVRQLELLDHNSIVVPAGAMATASLAESSDDGDQAQPERDSTGDDVALELASRPVPPRVAQAVLHRQAGGAVPRRRGFVQRW